MSFRQAHGIDDKSYKDLYLGDYFKIQDGTYNAVWMVAHFNYHYIPERPDGYGQKGVILIPRVPLDGDISMNATNTTENGYIESLGHTVSCAGVATALSPILGSYLLNTRILLSSEVDTTVSSMAGGGITGGTTSYAWSAGQCVLPNEIQIYGTTAWTSSAYDIGEANEKLAVFNFINQSEYAYHDFWLRNVVSSTQFALSGAGGSANAHNAHAAHGFRPLIQIS